MTPDALRAIADAADALGRLARAALQNAGPDPAKMLPLKDAAQIAGTSVGVVREAIRDGALAAYGRQRDRAVRFADLAPWIESRRVKPVAGPDDADIARRFRRLARGVKKQRRGKGRA
jgi:hypothetical protein